jgi:hypothetical protein
VAGNKILEYANGVTSGKGLDWMNYYLGGTVFTHSFFAGRLKGFVIGNTVNLGSDWIHGGWDPTALVVHELGHIWDNNSKGMGSNAAIFGGGISDKFAEVFNGNPTGLRFSNGVTGMPQWGSTHLDTNGNPYGNSGTSEYFAESFSFSILDPKNLPDPTIASTIQSIIATVVNSIP